MANETEALAADHGGPDLGELALEHAETGMPQLDPTIYPNLIFWLLVSIILLYMILSKVAIPRISSILAERSDAIAGDLETAQLYKRRAEEAEATYNTSLANARGEAQEIAADSKAQVNKELASVTAKAEAEIAARTAESEKRIAEIGESSERSVEEVARETAIEIVAAFLHDRPDAESVDAAVTSRLKG